LNTSKDVWADSAYLSEASLKELSEQGFRENIQRKGSGKKELTKREKHGNKTRSRIRSRVKHILAFKLCEQEERSCVELDSFEYKPKLA